MNLTDEEKDVVISALENLMVKLGDDISETDDQDENMSTLVHLHGVAKRLLNRLS